MYPRVHAETTPDKLAVVMAGGATVTYRELEDRSNQLANLCRQRGVDVGGQAAIWAENQPGYYEVYWAAMRSGLYLTGINRLATPEEAAYILRDSGARVLITSYAMRERAQAVAALVPECTVRLMLGGVVDGFESYEQALAAQPVTPLAVEPRGEVMLYSSGTTGRPKGIRRPLSGIEITDPAAVRTSAFGSALLGMGQESVYLMPAPLYHAAGLMWSSGTHELGGTVVAMERFDAEEMLRLIQEHRITHVQVVPTMMVRLLKLPAEVRERYDVSSLQCFLHAAAPCPVEVKRQMIAWLGPIVHEYYAATESNGLTYITSEEWLAHPGSVGRPVLGTLHICDDDGAEVPAGVQGAVYFEREGEVFSYHNDTAKTQDSRHPVHATWSSVGDLGYVDEEGYLYLTDRKSFTIISGGVNIYPAEIEACLIMHPKVADLVVFGLPDADMGESVHAVVEAADPAAAGPELVEELQEFARLHLSGYKVPRTIDFRSAIPRMATGKVNTSALRAEYLDR